MSLNKDVIQLSVEIIASNNQNEVSQQLRDITTESTNLRKENVALEKAMDALEKQGKKNSKEYEDLKKQYGENADKLKELTEQSKKYSAMLDKTAMSANQLKARANELRKTLNSMVKEADPEGWNRLNREYKETVELLKKTRAGAEETGNVFSNSLSKISPGLASFLNGIKAMTKASLAFIATPLGLVLAAIAGALSLVLSWFKRTEEGQSALAKASAVFGSILQSVFDLASKLGEAIFKAFTNPKQAISDLWEFIKTNFVNRLKAVPLIFETLGKVIKSFGKEGKEDLANAFLQLSTGVENMTGKAREFGKAVADVAKEAVEAAKISGELAAARASLERRQRTALVENEKLQTKINELQLIARDTTASIADRQTALNEIKRLENKLNDEKLAMAEENLRIMKAEAALHNSTKEQLNAVAEAEVEVIRLRGERAERLRSYLKLEAILTNEANAQVKAERDANEKILAEREKHFAALQKITDDYAKSQADKDAAEILAIQQKYEKAFDAECAALDKKLISREEYLLREGELTSMMEGEITAKRAEQRQKAEEKEKQELEKFAKAKADALKKYELMSVQELYAEELQQLQELCDKKLLTEEELQKAKAKLDKKYKKAQRDADQKAIDEFITSVREQLATVQAAVSVAGDLVTSMQDAEIADRNLKREQEMAALTEDYNAKMAAAEGNYEAQQAIKQQFEDEKAQMDYNAAKDNLDTQKKYADANFAIQATQAVITGIISAMQAFSAMSSIPIVGPVLGAIAAAAVGVTTAMQISSLNKERQRIKSTTLEAPSSSSGSSPPPTPSLPSPTREVKEEDLSGSKVVQARAKGKYDVVSEDDGKEYHDVPLVQSATGVVQRPTLVAEEPELVVSVKDFPYLRKHINYPLVIDAINDARNGRTVPARAQGSYENVAENSRQSATGNGLATDDLRLLTNTMDDVRELLAYLKAYGVEATAYYVVTEAEKQQKRVENARKNAQ
jgi:DNA repair exonuclease SbcCD ATPase subunit